MKRIRRYLKRWTGLSGRERMMLVEAATCLLFVKAGLILLPFAYFRKCFHWFCASDLTRDVSQHQVRQTAWAVACAADHLPIELLCLPRALATKYLLRKVSSVTLEIGVEINPSKAFEAHAWVERNGAVIIGDWPGSVSYQRLWVWE